MLKLPEITIVMPFNVSDKMKALIAAHGGKNSGSISGKTAFLLAGEKAGPEKLKKAESLGVRIISESEFMEEVLGEIPDQVGDDVERAGDDDPDTSLRGASATWQSVDFKETLF